MADRAVSTVVGYVLMVAVAAILLAGVSLAATTLVDSQDQRTTAAELDVFGERLASDISTADRLAQRGSNASVSVTSKLPSRIGDHEYTITVGDGSDGAQRTTIILESEDVGRSVETGVVNTTPIEHGEIRGGEVRITYDPDEDELVIDNA